MLENLEENIDIDDDLEDVLNEISIQEELKRIDNFEKEFIIDGDVINTGVYKEGMCLAQVFISMVKTMVNAGIDYNNSVVLCSNYFTHKQNMEIEKIKSVQLQQVQI